MYSYDASGRLTGVRKENSRQEFGYDPLGFKNKTFTWSSESAYTVQIFEHDLLGKVVESRLEDSSGNVYEKTSFKYDDLDNCIEKVEKTDYGDALTLNTYNSRCELIKSVDALGSTTTYDYNYTGVLTITETDPQGQQTITQYDGLGREHKQTIKSSFGSGAC